MGNIGIVGAVLAVLFVGKCARFFLTRLNESR